MCDEQEKQTIGYNQPVEALLEGEVLRTGYRRAPGEPGVIQGDDCAKTPLDDLVDDDE